MAAGEGVPSEAVAAQGAENPSGDRVFFGGLSGSSAVSSPRLARFSENEPRPFVVLVGIFDELPGGAIGRGDARGFSAQGAAGITMRSCGSSSSDCMAWPHRLCRVGKAATLTRFVQVRREEAEAGRRGGGCSFCQE